jgi:hypothetical protein
MTIEAVELVWAAILALVLGMFLSLSCGALP